MRITEAKAKEIWQNVDLRAYSHEECVAADRWVRNHALTKFKKYLAKTVTSGAIREFTYEMVRVHFGSVEVDQLMQTCDCYPKW